MGHRLSTPPVTRTVFEDQPRAISRDHPPSCSAQQTKMVGTGALSVVGDVLKGTTFFRRRISTKKGRKTKVLIRQAEGDRRPNKELQRRDGATGRIRKQDQKWPYESFSKRMCHWRFCSKPLQSVTEEVSNLAQIFGWFSKRMCHWRYTQKRYETRLK